MFEIKPWSEDLDLTEFYKAAITRGFINNSSRKNLVECFSNEREKQVWILFYKDRAVGSVAAHSFDSVMGENTYRIAARTCVFTDMLDKPWSQALKTKWGIIKNQNPTAQFLIPACIEWAPDDSRLFITSNNSEVGTQKKVHNIFGPLMEREGMMSRIKDVDYRGHIQTVWELHRDKFYEVLAKYPRWK
jgi:hypothetical protein